MKTSLYGLLFFLLGTAVTVSLVLFSRSHGELIKDDLVNDYIIGGMLFLVASRRFVETKPILTTFFGTAVMLHLGIILSYFAMTCILRLPDHFAYFGVCGYVLGIGVGIMIRHLRNSNATAV